MLTKNVVSPTDFVKDNFIFYRDKAGPFPKKDRQAMAHEYYQVTIFSAWMWAPTMAVKILAETARAMNS